MKMHRHNFLVNKIRRHFLSVKNETENEFLLNFLMYFLSTKTNRQLYFKIMKFKIIIFCSTVLRVLIFFVQFWYLYLFPVNLSINPFYFKIKRKIQDQFYWLKININTILYRFYFHSIRARWKILLNIYLQQSLQEMKIWIYNLNIWIFIRKNRNKKKNVY